MAERAAATGAELIADRAALDAFCDRQRRAAVDWLALDTEFVREKTYRPNLCLVQIAAGDDVVCIDPLGIGADQLDALRELLLGPALKVLHAAQQDLEIFYQLWGEVPAPLFDTQLAATLLGYGDQIGYAGLVQQMLGVTLDKSQTRTDWSRRPLHRKQIDYAADDVRYLARLYPQLRDRLRERGRLDWLADDFAALAEPQRYQPDPEGAWQRVKGSNRLRGVKLLALQKLAGWREREAVARDRPRRWLLADDTLLALATQMPQDEDGLERLRGAGAAAKRYGDDWLALLAEAKNTPREQWPAARDDGVKLGPAEDAVIDALLALVKLRAAESDISPNAIATRRELETLLAGGDGLRGWRDALVGQTLRDFIAGRSGLSVDGEALRIDPVVVE